MGLLSDIIQWQAQNVFCDPDRTLAEPIVYTSIVNGVAQPAVNLNVPILRDEPIVVGPENQRIRTRQIRFFLPAGVTAGCALGDGLMAPWRMGAAAEQFRVCDITSADAGGWEVLAEASAV
jgi:hypothetical protein